jgi:hypothetical protein
VEVFSALFQSYKGFVVASNSKSKPAAIRARLSHPVIDSDGHHVEYFPQLCDYVREWFCREPPQLVFESESI